MGKPSLLLLASPAEEERAVRIAAVLSGVWSVVRPPTGCLPGALARMAESARLVLHLDAAAAASMPPPAAPEVYAPAQFAGAGLTDPVLFAKLFKRERRLVSRACLVVSALRADSDAFGLLYGIAPSRLRFGPEAMLEKLLPLALDGPVAAGDAEGVLVAFNDAPVEHARSGGALRVREVLRALESRTVLVVMGVSGGMRLLTPRLLQLTVPKTPIHWAEEAQASQLTGLSVGDVLTAAHSLSNPALTAVAAALASRAKGALFSHCYMAPLLDVIRLAAPDLPVIYESHNVESELKGVLLGGHTAGIGLVRYVAELESRLLKVASLVTCCTTEDAASFAALARTVIVLEHGIAPPSRPVIESALLPHPLRVGFLASAHPPNVVAARFITDHLAPRCPAMVFEIVGSACAAIQPVDAPNVVLHGEVDEAQTNAILRDWFVALNPVEEGGGASVKIASYLGAGLPCMATPCGARSFDLAGSSAGWVMGLPGFADRLAALRLAPSERDDAARAALRLAAGRDWPERAEEARRALGLLTRRPADPPQPQRPVPLNGAQNASWAATLPSACLPYVLGGECHGDTVWAQHLHILPPPGASEFTLTLDPSGCQAPHVAVREGSSGRLIRSDRVDPHQDGHLSIPLPRTGGMVIEVEASAEPAMLIVLDAAFNLGLTPSLIELSERHRSGASCTPGECLPLHDNPVLPQTVALGEALALAGDVVSRALLVQCFLPAGPFVAIVCDGTPPLVRVRARDLARGYGCNVVVGRRGVLWLVPPSGPCRAASGWIAQLLIGCAERCDTLLALSDDAESRVHAVLASQLGIPATVRTRLMREG